MTQASIRPTTPQPPKQLVTLQLTAMQVPDANPVPQESRWGMGTDDGDNMCRLQLSPGETSELMVQIRNLGDRPLAISLVVTGDFPAPWHQVILDSPTLLNRQQKDASVYFTLDSDFFENRLALRPGTVRTLNYTAQVNLYATPAPRGVDGWMDPRDTDPPASPLPSSPASPPPSSLLPPPSSPASPPPSSLPSPPSSPPSQQLLATADFTLHIRPPTRYPAYLPAVYREIDFMNRFLAIFEQAFDPAVQTLHVLWAYLDPLTAPEAMLPFLAQWVGWPTDMAWSFSQRRLIRYALSIYRWRGTRWGMILFLHLYTGLPVCKADIPPSETHLIREVECEPADQPESLRHIRVDADSVDGFVVGDTHLGPDAMLGGGRPFHFTVRLRSPTPLNDTQVRRLIDQEKPAFCSYTLHIVYYDVSYDRMASDV